MLNDIDCHSFEFRGKRDFSNIEMEITDKVFGLKIYNN